MGKENPHGTQFLRKKRNVFDKSKYQCYKACTLSRGGFQFCLEIRWGKKVPK